MGGLIATIKLLLSAGLIGYLLLGLLLYLNQRNYIYYPTPPVPQHGLKELQIEVGDATLRVQVVNPGQANAILYFGGNGESVIHNADEFRDWFPGKSVYLVNYRGYGGSSGRPSEQALYRDALAVYDKVANSHLNIDLIGRSLGSGVATYLATRRPVNRLVLVTPFDSIVEVARRLYPYLPVRLLMHERYDSLARAPEIASRTLLLVAQQDRVIHPDHALLLAGAIRPELVTLELIEGAGHNDISLYPAYAQALREFLLPSGQQQK